MKQRGKSAKSVQSQGPKRGRTFTGCWNCRARKVKCDEASPECTQCRKHGTTCSGYESKLVWVTSDQKTYAPNGRRFLKCESTWDGIATMSTPELEYFVSLCDAAQYVKDFTVEWAPGLKIPFGAFPDSNQRTILPPPSPATLPRSLIYGSPLKDEELFLFRHYVDHVGFIMMPYEDQRNPWKSSYPAVALYYMSQNQTALYNALLAQAAYNLEHLDRSRRGKMISPARDHYYSSIRHLLSSLDPQKEDKKDFGNFLATIMTLMMVEIYSGSSKTWRFHFNGAWSYLKNHQSHEPWNFSSLTEYSTQSLCIVKIICETSKKPDGLEASDQDQFQAAVLSNMSRSPSFGFTVGASGSLMMCISDICQLAKGIKSGSMKQPIEVMVTELFGRLDLCRHTALQQLKGENQAQSLQGSKYKTMSFYQENAFIAATYIFLHRTVCGDPPRAVQELVAEVFHNVQAFLGVGVDESNMSLWPAFIAAVEASDTRNLSSAQSWLENASKVGMGNRLRIKNVIEKVWNSRKEKAKETGLELVDVDVDWRDVMAQLDIDIVLV